MTDRSRPGFLLRPIQPGDREPLYAVHRAAMRPSVEATWGWDDADQAGIWKRIAHDGVQVIEIDRELMGYLDVQEREDHIAIVNIVLGPDAQGRGIGSSIIGEILGSARDRGMGVRLRVLKTNPRARSLYTRLGFEPNGETSTHHEMIWRPSP